MSLFSRALVGSILALFSICSGCTKSVGGGSVKAAPNVLELDIVDAKLVSVQPAELRASMGSTPLFDFGFNVGNGNESVSINGRVPPSDIGNNSFTLSVSDGPTDNGFAAMQVTHVAGAPVVAGSTIKVDVTPNAIRGNVTLPSTGQQWPFSGELYVSCWVPRQSGQLPEGGGTSGDGALVEDTAFSSDLCAPLRAWAGKQ